MIRGVPFEPGNKHGRGRPKGSRNKGFFQAHKLFQQHAEPVMAKGLAGALQADSRLQHLYIKQINAHFDPSAKLKSPAIRTTADLNQAVDIVVNALAAGKITPARCSALLSGLSKKANIMELHEVAERLQRLEQVAQLEKPQ